MNPNKNENNNDSNRLDYIDILKAIAIIFVILGHINAFNSKIKVYIYAFHMPLFFICSGLTAKNRDYTKNRLKDIIINKFKSLYIPYILWGLIFSRWTWHSLINLVYGGYSALSQTTLSSLWFLPCLFVSSVLFELINYIFKKLKFESKIILLLSVVITIVCILASYYLPQFSDLGYPLCFNVSLMAIAFMFIGKGIQILSNIIKLNESKLYTLVLLFILFFIVSLSSVLNNNIPNVLMANNQYGNLILFLFTAIFSSLTYYILAIILDKILKENIIKNIITYIGKNTLIIFVMHKKILKSLSNIMIESVNLPNFILLAIVAIITIFVTCLISVIINRFIPILAGKYRKKAI